MSSAAGECTNDTYNKSHEALTNDFCTKSLKRIRNFTILSVLLQTTHKLILKKYLQYKQIFQQKAFIEA